MNGGFIRDEMTKTGGVGGIGVFYERGSRNIGFENFVYPVVEYSGSGESNHAFLKSDMTSRNVSLVFIVVFD